MTHTFVLPIGTAALGTVAAGTGLGAYAVASVVLCVAWAGAASAALFADRQLLARTAGLVLAAQIAATVWPRATPVAVAAWLVCALSLPEGLIGSWPRRIAVAAGLAVAAAWTVWLPVTTGGVIAWIAAAGTAALIGVLARCPRAPATHRRVLQWVGAAAVVTAAADAVLIALNLLLDMPGDGTLLPWLLAAMVVLPAGLTLAQIPAVSRLAERALVEAVVVAGLGLLVVAVYLVVVIGLGHEPVGTEHDVLLASVMAALIAVVLALPLRFRLVSVGQSMLGRRGRTPEEALASFGARMSRAVPFDELLLQLVESLRATLGPQGAEVWVGTAGLLHLTSSVPERPEAQITLNDRERLVVGRTRIGGNAWLTVWLPALLDGYPAGSLIRVAPAAHLGELLGLLVVRRPPEGVEFTDEDDRVLIELARQVGLALHNMRLDNALQASLEELRQRNEELQASRLRIVTAADASRRAIERDLHDGAQQHLVALSVKLGLVREIIKDDPGMAAELLEELRTDLQNANAAFRELAHGIYPPLLRNHGLGEALRSVTRRVALPYQVNVELPRRYPEQVEAAVYFCCLEAVQNAGKYAGAGATIEVSIQAEQGRLSFAVIDDGVGFDAHGNEGHGFVNMADRLGAIGGVLRVESAPGAGTAVRGDIPIPDPPASAPLSGPAVSRDVGDGGE
ncbi:histidine kinase [Nonomuraea angiospora]|uniref:sensor histidine kinase n=1 Tax=Nonomuraea angiospora TaxID=46172 RepID=UPI0033D80F27